MSLVQAVLAKKLQVFLQTEVSTEFAELIAPPYIDFNAAAALNNGKKKRNCTSKSVSCGYSCQPKTSKSGKKTQCNSELDQSPSEYAAWLGSMISNVKSAPTSTKKETGATPSTSQSLGTGIGPHKEVIKNGSKSVGKKELKDLDDALILDSSAQKLLKEFEIATKELDFEFDKNPDTAFKTEAGKKYIALNTEIKAKQEESDQKALAVMGKIRSKLIDSYPEEEARAMANSVKIYKKALSQASEQEYRDTMTEFFRITSGWGSGSLKKIVLTDERAYADDLEEVINIGKSSNKDDWKRTLFHEMGHHLEFDDENNKEIALSWVKSRATGEYGSLKEITKGKYQDEDNAYPDKFIDPYVGKFYLDNATEVFSMGLQHFTDAKSMLELYKKDREHFLLVIG